VTLVGARPARTSSCRASKQSHTHSRHDSRHSRRVRLWQRRDSRPSGAARSSRPRLGAWSVVGHNWPEEPPSGQREFPRCLGLTLVRARRARGTQAQAARSSAAHRRLARSAAVPRWLRSSSPARCRRRRSPVWLQHGGVVTAACDASEGSCARASAEVTIRRRVALPP
jgi:hypothetical protein